jgi:hypothetical protein
MFEEGIPTELINAESVAEYESRHDGEEVMNDAEAWKYQ